MADDVHCIVLNRHGLRLGRAATAVGVVGLACLLASCQDQGEAPVGKLRIEPGLLAVSYPGYRDLRIDLLPTARLVGVDGKEVERPILFVHLLGEPGEVLRTFDQPLPYRWQEGKRQRYPLRIFQSALARPLPPGRYGLSVGLYEAGGRRWPLDVQGEEVDRYEYLVAEVEVAPATTREPAFDFSAGWLEPEVGNDQQVLVRRWLETEGRIDIGGLVPPGRLWLTVRIPTAPERGVRVLGEGHSAPMVGVSSTCGDLEIGISGTGHHEIEIPVISAEAAVTCSLTFRANFYDQLEGSFDRRSCVLETIAWIGR